MNSKGQASKWGRDHKVRWLGPRRPSRFATAGYSWACGRGYIYASSTVRGRGRWKSHLF